MSYFENLPSIVFATPSVPLTGDRNLPYPFSKITPSLFTLKEGSTSHPDPLTLRGEGGNRPTRCSEPLRSKVGGPSKVFAMVVRDGTALLVVSVNRYYRCLSNVYNGV